jgi:phosphopantothenoylcysteine synthetase/decarboxylase
MTKISAIYYVISGASAARCAPELIRHMAELDLPIFTLLTENAHRILSPYHLADLEGHILVDSYFDPALHEGRQPGLTLVAPATFNTVNKIAQGIADTLAHSLVAEAIGAGWPVILAPSMNPALANHPQMAQSLKNLQRWGVKVVEPHMEENLLVMASTKKIMEAIRYALAGAQLDMR